MIQLIPPNKYMPPKMGDISLVFGTKNYGVGK